MKMSRVLALDLGSAAFKLILLEVQEGRERVIQVRIAELPAPSDAKGREAALKSLLTGLELGGLSQVVSVVDDPYACLRVVSTPPMPAAEQRNAIRWQLQPFLAFPPEEAAIEFEPGPSATDPGDRKPRFLAAAFPLLKIREHLELLAQAGIHPTQLLPKQMAIGTWLKKASVPQVQGGVAVLELGGSGCEFIVLENGRPAFTRKIPGGAVALTQEMTGVLMTERGQVSLTEEEAETFKRSVGIPHSEEDGLLQVKGVSGSQIFSLIRTGLERLAMEVERSLAFYGESGGQSKIESIFLVGGGAHLKGLAPWLQERFGVSVIPAPVLEAVSPASGVLQGSASAVPLSLVPALGGAFGQGKGMNLLPEELQVDLRRKIQRVALKGLLTGVVLGAFLLWMGIQLSRRSLVQQIAAFDLEQQAVASQMAQIQATLTAHDRVAGEPDWETALRWLSQVVPPEIFLMEFSADGLKVSLRGRVRRRSRPPDEVLGEFMRQLGGGRMTQVTLRSSRLIDAAGTSEFEIAGEIR